MRLFIGIPLPEEIREYIGSIFNKYTYIEGTKWVKKDNLHITLKFLGEVHESKKENVIDKLDRIKDFTHFETTIESVGAFPSQKNPRVIWVGIEKGKEIIKEINKNIEKILKKEGFKEEKRFHPHITICRVKKYSQDTEKIFTEKINNVFNVTSFNLYESILRREGPEYKIIKSFHLT